MSVIYYHYLLRIHTATSFMSTVVRRHLPNKSEHVGASVFPTSLRLAKLQKYWFQKAETSNKVHTFLNQTESVSIRWLKTKTRARGNTWAFGWLGTALPDSLFLVTSTAFFMRRMLCSFCLYEISYRVEREHSLALYLLNKYISIITSDCNTHFTVMIRNVFHWWGCSACLHSSLVAFIIVLLFTNYSMIFIHHHELHLI